MPFRRTAKVHPFYTVGAPPVRLLQLAKINLIKEEKMFEVTEKATEMIKEFFKSKPQIPSIRIEASGGG